MVSSSQVALVGRRIDHLRGGVVGPVVDSLEHVADDSRAGLCTGDGSNSTRRVSSTPRPSPWHASAWSESCPSRGLQRPRG